jgi:hypothetical protein
MPHWACRRSWTDVDMVVGLSSWGVGMLGTAFWRGLPSPGPVTYRDHPGGRQSAPMKTPGNDRGKGGSAGSGAQETGQEP